MLVRDAIEFLCDNDDTTAMSEKPVHACHVCGFSGKLRFGINSRRVYNRITHVRQRCFVFTALPLRECTKENKQCDVGHSLKRRKIIW